MQVNLSKIKTEYTQEIFNDDIAQDFFYMGRDDGLKSLAGFPPTLPSENLTTFFPNASAVVGYIAGFIDDDYLNELGQELKKEKAEQQHFTTLFFTQKKYDLVLQRIINDEHFIQTPEPNSQTSTTSLLGFFASYSYPDNSTFESFLSDNPPSDRPVILKSKSESALELDLKRKLGFVEEEEGEDQRNCKKPKLDDTFKPKKAANS